MSRNVCLIGKFVAVKHLPRPVDHGHRRIRAQRHPLDRVNEKTQSLGGCEYPDDPFFSSKMGTQTAAASGLSPMISLKTLEM